MDTRLSYLKDPIDLHTTCVCDLEHCMPDLALEFFSFFHQKERDPNPFKCENHCNSSSKTMFRHNTYVHPYCCACGVPIAMERDVLWRISELEDSFNLRFWASVYRVISKWAP